MGLAKIVASCQALPPTRKERLKRALVRVNTNLRFLVFAQPSGDAACDAVDMEYHCAEDHREKLLRGEFPRHGFEEFVIDGDHLCEDCQGGHVSDCESLPIEDLYDCLWKRCKGCCPNGCPEHGLARMATIEGEKLGRSISLGHDSPRHEIASACAANAGGLKGPKCGECRGWGFHDLGPDSSTSTCDGCGGSGVDREALHGDIIESIGTPAPDHGG